MEENRRKDMEMMLEKNKVYIENKLREQEERIINEIQEKGSNAENKTEEKTPPRIVRAYSYDNNDTNERKTAEMDTNELMHAKTNIISEIYVEEDHVIENKDAEATNTNNKKKMVINKIFASPTTEDRTASWLQEQRDLQQQKSAKQRQMEVEIERNQEKILHQQKELLKHQQQQLDQLQLQNTPQADVRQRLSWRSGDRDEYGRVRDELYTTHNNDSRDMRHYLSNQSLSRPFQGQGQLTSTPANDNSPLLRIPGSYSPRGRSPDSPRYNQRSEHVYPPTRVVERTTYGFRERRVDNNGDFIDEQRPDDREIRRDDQDRFNNQIPK
jgi:hypothetical protein